MISPEPELPAPWSLTGSGYIVALKAPAANAPGETFLAASLEASRRGSVAWLIFADYATSDCGPYHELLYMPGRCDFGGLRLLTISRIFVSTEVSVVNGRRNWGIPKQRADFEVSYGNGGIDHVRVSLIGRAVAEFAFQPFGPSLPITTALVPPGLRTLGQRYEGRRFVYTPRASGRARLARLVSAWTDAALFPDVSPQKAYFALRADPFAMTFPATRDLVP